MQSDAESQETTGGTYGLEEFTREDESPVPLPLPQPAMYGVGGLHAVPRSVSHQVCHPAISLAGAVDGHAGRRCTPFEAAAGAASRGLAAVDTRARAPVVHIEKVSVSVLKYLLRQKAVKRLRRLRKLPSELPSGVVE